jgi:hypothetical protein
MSIYTVCKEGNLQEFMTHLENEKQDSLNWGKLMIFACKSENVKLVEYILPLYKKYHIIDNIWPYEDILSTCLHYCCSNDNLELVNTIMNYEKINKNQYLYTSCKGGYIVVVKHLVLLGANNYNLGLCGSLEKNHLDIAEYMVSLGADLNSLSKEYKNNYLLTKVINNKYNKIKDNENVFEFIDLDFHLKLKICNYL